MSECVVDIHVPSSAAPTPEGSHIDRGLSGWARPDLAVALADRDVKVLFSRGRSAFDLEQGEVAALEPIIRLDGDAYTVVVTPAHVALATIGAIRNTSGVIGGGVPELNTPAVRAATRDKARTNELLGEVGLAKAFAAWNGDSPIDAALELLPGDRVVLKPRTGRQSRSIYIGTKRSIADLAASGGLPEEDWIIEEEVGFTLPMAVRGIDEQQQAMVDDANVRGLRKELRAYTFGRGTDGQLVAQYVLRVAGDGDHDLHDDHWVFIDQDSVPDAVRLGTEQVTQTFAAATGASELHLGVDWVLAQPFGASDALWLPMEVNSGEPQLVQRNEHAPTARTQAVMLAEQLHRISLVSQKSGGQSW